MKFNGLIIASILPIFLPLFGCNNDNSFKPEIITYGTKLEMQEDYYNAVDKNTLTANELLTKLNNQETFLLYFIKNPSAHTCTCVSDFGHIVKLVNNELGLPVYCFDSENANEDLAAAKITVPSGSNNPNFLNIYIKGKFAKQFVSTSNPSIFKSKTDFLNTIQKYIKLPKLMMVNENYLDSNVIGNTNSNITVLIERNGCPDCQYLIPNVIIPYLNKNQTDEIYVLDIEYAMADSSLYDSIKAKYQLPFESNNTFGYRNGRVPTAQYYKNGSLYDASVYFNDSYELDVGQTFYTITESFYDQNRINSLHYLDNVTDPVLVGKTLQYFGEGEYAKEEQELAKLHTPLFNAFLDFYVKK